MPSLRRVSEIRLMRVSDPIKFNKVTSSGAGGKKPFLHLTSDYSRFFLSSCCMSSLEAECLHTKFILERFPKKSEFQVSQRLQNKPPTRLSLTNPGSLPRTLTLLSMYPRGIHPKCSIILQKHSPSFRRNVRFRVNHTLPGPEPATSFPLRRGWERPACR